MSEGSETRGGSVGMSVGRPERIQELRDAAETEDAGAVATAAIDDRTVSGSGAGTGSSSAGGSVGSSTGSAGAPDATTRRRGPLVVAAVAVVVAVAIGGALLVAGRSGSTDAAGPAPTTAAPGPTTTAPRAVVAPEAVASEERHEAMCEAAGVYAIDDMVKLGDNVVADPDAFLAAYESLAVNVPGELRSLVDQMGPLTRKVVVVAKAGELTSTAAVQAWLVAMPASELEAWVGAQQELAPEIVAACI